MKKGIVIGASDDSIYAINKAREMGIYVYAIDGNPQAKGLSVANESIVVDISDIDRVDRVIDDIKPDFTIPIPIGKYLTTIGHVNDKYGLYGMSYKAANNSTDKYLFHKLLNENGLRMVDLQLVNQNNLAKPICYPAIMKPRFGSGSRDVYYISNKEDFQNINRILEKSDEDFVLEEAVQGTEYGLDGAVINGKLLITLVRKKEITPLPIRQAIASFAVNANANVDLLNRIRDKVQKAVNVLEYDNCLLNVDMIINDDEVFIIEMAPRPAGHSMHSIFVPASTGVDMIGEYLRFIMGYDYNFEPKTEKKMKMVFYSFENVLVKRVPTIEQIQTIIGSKIVLWNCNIKVGEYLKKVTNGASIMNRGYFVVEGEDERDLNVQSQKILELFELEDI